MISLLQGWRYSEEHHLGGGGYSEVYRCQSSIMLGDYAIKVFNDPGHVNTFDREIRALKLLENCPDIAHLIDYGRNSEHKLCIVTELISGTRLDQHPPLSYELTLQLLEQCLAVLSYSHGKGLLHKDIKASNILVNKNRFTVLDWGVAEFVGNGRAKTIFANQDFVAPECFYGKHGVASDFYSLAWLAVYALTGDMPYDFSTIKEKDYRVVAHCLQRPVLPEKIPEELRCLIYSWLSKNPAKRLVGYDLSFLLKTAKGSAKDFIDDKNLSQIQREFSYLHLAAKQGIPYGQYQFAMQLQKQDCIDEAIFWLQKAQEAGSVQATYKLARIFANRGKPYKKRAQDLMQNAADNGHAKAQYRLGRSYLQSDTEQAAVWLRLAADNGLASAQYELGKLLQNFDEALAYLEMALERGYTK